MGLFGSKASSDKCRPFDFWSYMVQKVQTLEDWQQILAVMFEDCIYHRGRSTVVETFTQDIIEHLSSKGSYTQAALIEKAYEEWILKVNNFYLRDPGTTTLAEVD